MSDANESLLDEAVTVALIVDRLAAAAQKKVSARLATLRGEISRLIVEFDFTDAETPAAAAYQRDRVIDQASALIFSAYQDMMRQTNDGLIETAELAEESLENKIGVLLGGAVAKLALGRIADIVNGTRLQGPTVTEWWGKQSGDLRFRFAAAVHDAYGRGLGLQDTLRAIRGTAASRYADGILGPSRRHAEGLVMSAYHAAASATRLAVMERHMDYIRAIQHLSVLDNRTCLVAGTRLQTPLGQRFIEEIGTGDIVTGGSRLPRMVVGTQSKSVRKLVRVKLDNGTVINCTPDHMFLVETDGQFWREAQDLRAGEEIASVLR